MLSGMAELLARGRFDFGEWVEIGLSAESGVRNVESNPECGVRGKECGMTVGDFLTFFVARVACAHYFHFGPKNRG
jgi:hypothetical protein